MLRRLIVWLPLAACATASAPKALPERARSPSPPVPKVVPSDVTAQGEHWVDNYAWLRNRDAPEVLDYLRAENAYSESALRQTLPAQKILSDELVRRQSAPEASVPTHHGGWAYYQRTAPNQQYPTLLRRRDAPGSAEETILDINELARGKTYLKVKWWWPSDDGSHLAYATDDTGNRQWTLFVKDLRTGELGPERIAIVEEAAWSRDNQTLFYSLADPVLRLGARVYRHTLGTPPDQDVLLYQEADGRADLRLHRSEDGDYIFLVSWRITTSDVRFIATDHPTDAPRLIAPHLEGHRYDVEHRGDAFYIRTNLQAPHFHLVKAPVLTPDPDHWTEVAAPPPDGFLEDFDLYRDYVVLWERYDWQRHLRVVEFGTGQSQLIPLPEENYALDHPARGDFDSPRYRYQFGSPITPPSVYEYDVARRTQSLASQRVIPGLESCRYSVERVLVRGPDGVPISVTLTSLRGLPRDGSNPLLLTGYAAYAFPYQSFFDADRLSLIDRGVIYAVVHARGGGEQGPGWYDEGRLLKKKNSFADFIAAAEGLVEQGYTRPEHLGALGISAGGLLVAAAVNLRPDLFKVVVLRAPFTHVLTAMLDPALPLTQPEYDQWGNPQADPKALDYIRSYSPYENIAPKDYPAMLVLSHYQDSQVPYWDPASYVARLRALKTDRHPLLLHMALEASDHGGSSSRSGRAQEQALEDAFLLDQLGVPVEPLPAGSSCR